MLQPQRLAQGIQQEGLARARGPDEQQRILGDEGREDDRSRPVKAVGADGAEVGRGGRSCGRKTSFHGGLLFQVDSCAWNLAVLGTVASCSVAGPLEGPLIMQRHRMARSWAGSRGKIKPEEVRHESCSHGAKH